MSSKTKPHPIFELLEDKTAILNNPDLAKILGSKRDAEVLMLMAYLEKSFDTPSRWFQRTYAQLTAKLGISESTLRRSIGRLQQSCLEVDRMKSLFHKGKPVNRYRLNWEVLSQQVQDYYARTGNSEAADVSHPDVDEVFGPSASREQPVRMTASRDIRDMADTLYGPWQAESVGELDGSRKAQRRKDNPVGRQAHRRSISIMHGVVVYTRRESFKHSTKSLGRLTLFGYDNDFNPRGDRLPEPGEPEVIVCAEFHKIPPRVESWLATEALQRPIIDIITATRMAANASAEHIIEIADEIARQRQLKAHASDGNGPDRQTL